MVGHSSPAAFSRLNLISRPARLVFAALVAGLLIGCAPHPVLQPGLELGLQLAYGD